MTAEEITAAKAAICRGWTIGKIVKGDSGANKKIVHAGIFFAQCKRDLAFGQFMKQAAATNNKRGQKIRWTRFHNASVRDDNNDYYKIRGMIPEGNPHRDDIVARIFEDMLNGSLERQDVPIRVQTYVAEMNRLYPTKYRKFGDGLLVSLDEVLFDDGSTTRGDTVSRGLWD
jgi:hypothetical protein